MINKKIKIKIGVIFLILLLLDIIILLEKYNFSFINETMVSCMLILIAIVFIVFMLFTHWYDGIFIKAKKALLTVLDYFQVFVSALLCLQLVFLFVLFPVVKGPSMFPTLYNGERIVVSRDVKEVERFDVVIFIIDHDYLPKAPMDEEGELWVKRVIGLPGDKITYENGKLYINGEYCEETYLHGDMSTVLPNDLNGVTIPEGYYLLLGDNRDESMDSRYIGFVSENLLIGKGKYIITSLTKWDKIK